jgi:hypothetical protein
VSGKHRAPVARSNFIYRVIPMTIGVLIAGTSLAYAVTPTHTMKETCDAALRGNLSSADKTWARSCSRVAAEGERILSAPTPTPSASPSATPSPTPSVTPSSTPSPTPSPTPSETPPPQAWPNSSNTGVPAGWVPAQTITNDDLVITSPGIVQDVRVIGGSIRVMVAGVTIRRAEVIGTAFDQFNGGIYNNAPGAQCRDMVVEDSWIHATSPSTVANAGQVVGPGGYTARRVHIGPNITEGFRVGEKDHCGPVVVEDSFVTIDSPSDCVNPPYPDWHGDGLQGIDGAALTIKHSTIQMIGNPPSKAPCEGTSPFFWPDQGNGPVTINGLIVSGGTYYSLRIATGGSVSGLLVDSHYSGVTVTTCSILTNWEATSITLDSDYQPVAFLAPVQCKE